MRRIGIFGGSFDPVHLGHVGLAADALKQAELEKVVFIPARKQPFKLERRMASSHHRLSMLEMALNGMEGMEISSYELNVCNISYTYLTMRAMQSIYGENARLYFIMGTDAFLKIQKWRNAEELLKSYAYIIGTRPGYKDDQLKACIGEIREKYGTEIIHIDNVQVDISSTEIRRCLETGESMTDVIPARVEGYIKEHGLYR